MARPDPRVRDHEAAHVATARVYGLELEPVEFDTMAWDGWFGRVALTARQRAELQGTYTERLQLSVVAFAPVAMMLDADGIDRDLALVRAMCPRDLPVELWRVLVDAQTREMVATEEFAEAFGDAVAEIDP